MSGTYTKAHREVVAPFTAVVEDYYDRLKEGVVALDDDALEAVKEAALAQSNTNCGWMEYEAGRAVLMWAAWSRNERARRAASAVESPAS